MRLQVSEYQVTLRHQRPLTIALVADCHDAPCGRILSVLHKRRPNLIAIAGDLVNAYYRPSQSQTRRPALRRHYPDKVHCHVPLDQWNAFDFSPNALKLLTVCSRLAPTFYSLGNHEWILSESDKKRIATAGACLLDNAYQPLSLGGSNPLWIGGLTSATITRFRAFKKKFPDEEWTKRYHSDVDYTSFKNQVLAPEYSWLSDFEKEDGDKLLLSHHPEYWTMNAPFLRRHAIDLVVSGHAHGGQIRIFGQGLFAPGQGFLPLYTSGLHKGRHGSLIISRGLFNSAVIPRIANPPELVLIHTRPI